MNKKNIFNPPTAVENHFLNLSKLNFCYDPDEKIPVIQVNNFPSLGQLTALRFLEWVQSNPEGVVSLPTGKTPEYFIRYAEHYLKHWEDKTTSAFLEEVGFDHSRKPDLQNLQFVQIDEFFPISPTQHNSFFDYVMKYYINGFGISAERAQLIDATQIILPQGKTYNEIFPDDVVDLSLRFRQPKTTKGRLQKEAIERVDEFCTDYERRIREKDGIGFFLGGIGPDGHIAFNVRGSDYYSTTRLTPTNFETQAAAAGDLGGIEVSQKRLVITIGLQTITHNPDATCLIFAAGEAKAKIVAGSVQEPANNTYPAGALHNMRNARFYITSGAAVFLDRRQAHEIERSAEISEELIDQHLITLSMRSRTPIQDITEGQVAEKQVPAIALKKSSAELPEIKERIFQDLAGKLNRGLTPVEDDVFFHTAPHHDDIMLGYLAHIVHLVRTPRNEHHFAYMTSGFNAVTNEFVKDQILNALEHMGTEQFNRLKAESYYDAHNEAGAQRDIYTYLDGVAHHSRTLRNNGSSRRLIRNLLILYPEYNLDTLTVKMNELIEYLDTRYPGQKDDPVMQLLKGRIREWEADLVWGHYGTPIKNVHHLRLGFYKGDIFTEDPTMDRDVQPILEYMEKIRPTVVTLALDPEASGPDTHYKVMQAIAEAIRLYKERHPEAPLRVWGYRNVWFKFQPTDVNIFVPVSLNSMAIMKETFKYCFQSQVDAPFPSFEFNGPFSGLAQAIQVQQHQDMKRVMGRDFWYENTHPRVRAAHGLVYLKEMELEEFYTRARELQKVTESQA
ncbi:MAG: glucosamine-6-phosphate deaminase [Candidatus Marinimicrobia bacterium]|nr:glucosamine-6-phosphate deaminase [Candidatus Neomarinimicrobiota bacterium]MBT3577134.1 glucosamine-6-phosphate deaminase [Candidatus Neomarinimicrobiota bacterium]MBT3680016.1 glucosamine-6-phosphate deaminase [Candidatus Neomarinimicrobiota bacterium]MBT3949589.1 glucosamine-6-phosphate deaminase [Candidatus Neomarinimicrobiota bacterium]MBT4253260.1 glucosamine-6-phosphate deaminase [Candidatus Neomarinimicrobiota bacterium]